MIKTCEVIQDETETLEQYIEQACKDNGITKDNLIDIKYHKSSLVEPYYDYDHYLDKNAHTTSTITSALIIWDDDK